VIIGRAGRGFGGDVGNVEDPGSTPCIHLTDSMQSTKAAASRLRMPVCGMSCICGADNVGTWKLRRMMFKRGEIMYGGPSR
jgi:hypothetical protein